MPKPDFLDLDAKLSRFQTLVRANRAGCDTRFAEVLHDRLLDALEILGAVCQEGAETERMLEIETDPARRDALDEAVGNCWGDLESGGGGFYPWHLLDSVDRDPDFGGYVHPVAARWCHGPIPEWMAVCDTHLCGLGGIIERIADETGIRFTAYLCDAGIGPDGAGELDPAIYETPIGNIRYR
jgi:hypothetical protein